MAFTIKQMINKKELRPDYVSTAFMFDVNEATIKKLSTGAQFALGQIEFEQQLGGKTITENLSSPGGLNYG
jgi:hypothetical protein